jgi:hypothetical protein
LNKLIVSKAFFGGAICFLIILSFKVFFISKFAVDIPWSDQWDGELELLYLKDTLSFNDLWMQANEHHIVLTKILNILSFRMSNQSFNQINALYLQSIIFALSIAVISYVFIKNKVMPVRIAMLLLLFIPAFDWENIYWSYQSQVYFSVLFGIIGCYLCSKEKINLFQILFLTLIAGLSNAAALYIPIMAAFSITFQLRQNKIAKYQFVFCLFLSFFSYKLFAAQTPWHDQYKANSLETLTTSSIKYLAWPENAGWLLWVLLASISLVTAFHMYKNDKKVEPLERFGLFLAAWFFLFLLSTIYSRALFMVVPVRYYTYYLVFGCTALLCFRFNLAPLIRNSVMIFILILYLVTLEETYTQWCNYSLEKNAYRNNFIETLIIAKNNQNAPNEFILENLKKLPLPYAGYPNYDVPLRVIRNPKTWKMFNFMIEKG